MTETNETEAKRLIPENSLQITVSTEGDLTHVSSGYHFTDDFDKEKAAYFLALMDGILLLLEADPDQFLKAAEIGYAYENMREAMRVSQEQEKLDALPDAENLIKMKIKGGVQ